MAGIYIHIPFCKQFCIYCDFYSTQMLSKREDFVKALKKEIKDRSKEYSQIGGTVNTIYFGGGTPSVLKASELASILRTIRKYYPISDANLNSNLEPEITIEVNPDDVTLAFMLSLKKAGFNRLSMGVQSFYDSHLKWMNRRHSGAQAIKAFKVARQAGFENISIDLIFGFEGLTNHMFKENIKTAISLSPEHVSSYQMGIEKGTKLYEDYLSGEYMALNDQSSLCQYSSLQTYLAEAGYVQYEVSSFCKPGMKSKHNSAYWNFTPYLGFGPAAHSFNGRERVWNCRGVNSYINGVLKGERLYKAELLSPKDCFNEFIMLSLRTTEGMNKRNLEGFSQFVTSEFTATLNSFLGQGVLIEESDQIKIPSEKLFLSDGIIRELFA